jgi:L-alanine-DL-glutamate epimerase-like enolase superfamily enzyme
MRNGQRKRVKDNLMKIESVQVTPVSIPYRHREVSTRVSRAGVTNVVVRIETNNGLVGWGECCSGFDTLTLVGRSLFAICRR